MMICLNICGNDVLNWKVDCDDYLPDNKGIFYSNNKNIAISMSEDTELGAGRERICVLPKDKYRQYHGVCSCAKSWTDTIAVTR